MKTKPIKPLPSLKQTWRKDISLHWLPFWVCLLCFAITIWVSDQSYKIKIQEQDRKIENLYDSYIGVVNLQIDTSRQLDRAILEIKTLKEGHTMLKTRSGLIYSHNPLNE
jgi:hypothetical protein